MCFVVYAFVVTNWKLASNKKNVIAILGFLFFFIFAPNRNVIAISFVSFKYLCAFFFRGNLCAIFFFLGEIYVLS